MQRHAANELDVEVAHAKGAHRAFAHQGEDLGQDVVEAFAAGHFLAQFDDAAAHGLVGQGLDLRLEGVYRLDKGAQAFQIAIIA